MPSHWMTRGLQAAARGDLAEAVYPLTLLWANGLMLYLVAAWRRRGCTAAGTTASRPAATCAAATAAAGWTRR